ncbi:cysteine hydrolase family protein [Halotalea alkalilenta]|uniref:cysteine hydrolase family protein n=1 Tax=Halotalea alkalilenta TaxID=376489 RepID=UPI0009DFDA69|nr:isochorismatase family protein [Halotalea alkalilenta]
MLEFTDRAAATFTKRVHNAFTDTGPEAWLREHGIRRVVIYGIRTEQCCEATARVGPRPGGRDSGPFSARCGSS